MTLRTVTQYLIRNERTGETDPRRWLTAHAARQAALGLLRGNAAGFYRIYTELLVIQPEAEQV